MRFSSAQTPRSDWYRVLGSYGVVLALELILAILIMVVFDLTPNQLLGPFLAFAVPPAIFLIINQAILRGEKNGVSPNRLGLSGGLCMGLFATGISFALLFSAQQFNLIDPNEMGNIIFAAVLTIITCSVSGYFVVQSRATKGRDDGGGANTK